MMTASTASLGTPGGFVSIADLEAIQPMPGITMRTIAGDAMMICFATLEPGAVLPLHHHVHEQISTVLEGELIFTADGETRTLRAGDVAVLLPNVPHSAVAGDTGCRAIDIFSPPREDFLRH